MSLDLRPRHRALQSFGARFIDDTLPATLRAGVFGRHAPKASTVELERGCGAWQAATLNEYRSQVAFTGLLHELTCLGLPNDALQTLSRIVRDEAVHVELARRLVVVLGGGDVIPGEPAWVVSDESLPPYERALDQVVGSLCLAETVSCALLGAARDAATDPLTHAMLTRFTADESIHGSAGFALLELMLPGLPRHSRAAIRRRANEQLQAVWDICHQPFDDAPHPFGALSMKAQAPVLAAVLRRRLLPAFERLGIPLRAPSGPKRRRAPTGLARGARVDDET